ncbi:beta-lactam-binding protein with PASTA domain/predicted Ser/Thr protein kinase [Marmoricola sp. OAE513]|uniref:Stk1 family PASTA domain-containing Ser/Thr kinase n=1 Tax=Marmoricola sp. OAE513 TaxID=2817894 RepID=UPI001AEAD943
MVEPHRIGGRYEIGELLGRGGMAEVRKGTDIRLGRTVAVKRLRTDLASDATFQARFRREAQSAASLNHPAIVSVYDTGEEMADDAATGQPVAQPYIVMEYVAGRTLREILREGRKILPERALEITSGTLGALDYSHRAGIIHRDIKPGNVMLTPAGDVKVMDFGIARAVADAQSTMTQTAAVVGTAQYLSPEQARGETVDSRSDVYSTGCLLFELLTGRPPFVGDSPVAVAYQHVREQAPAPSSFDADLPPEVDQIVAKALAKRVEDRYQSAAAMKEDVDRFLAGRPVQAPPVPVTPPVPVVATLPTDTAATSVVPGAQEWTEEPERRKVAPYVIIGLIVLALLIGGGLMLRDVLGNDSPEEVSLPRVTNMTQVEAEKAITDAGLEVGEITQEFNDEEPAGNVLSQDPDPASDGFVAPGTSVDLVVSKGKAPPETATIPPVVGQTKSAAEAALREAGFVVKIKTVKQTSDERLDEVVGVSPEVGKTLELGKTVTLKVSEGPPVVPDVVGLSEEDAKKILREAGFKVTVQPAAGDAEHPAGEVLFQTLPAGTKQDVKTPIFIQVSTYVEPPPPTNTPTEDPTLPVP